MTALVARGGWAVPLSAAERRRNRQGDQVAIGLLVTVWLYIMGVPIVGRALGTSLDVWGELLIACATVASVAVVIRWFPDLVEAGLWRLLVMVAPPTYIMIRNLYGGILDFHGITVIGITMAIAAARPRASILRMMAVLMVVAAVAAIALGFLRPDLGIKHTGGELTVRADKEIFPSLGLLIGFHDEENTMGQIMALGLPFMMLIERRWLRLGSMAVLVFTLLWTSSRGAMITAAVVAALMFALPRIRPRAVRSWVERGVLVGAMAVCAALPWLLRPADDAFSARGGIWRGATQAWWSQDRLFGLDAEWFTRMTTEASSPVISAAVSGHNQMVQLGVTGGLVQLGLAILQALSFNRWTTRTHSRHDVLSTLVITAMWVGGWLEQSFGYIDQVLVWPVTYPILAVLLFCRDPGRRPVQRTPTVPAQEHRWPHPD